MGVIDHATRLYRVLSRIRQYARFELGRVVGTTTANNGRYKQLLSDLERSYFMRAELNAVAKVLIDKGLITQPEWEKLYAEEAEHLEKELFKKRYPEIEPNEDGTAYTIKDRLRWQQRMLDEEWPP